ncbi:MAG: GDP-mannose 4,6-dehydratase, partial [Pseudomonadota bacterium]|nr:GDP-mannose 4,6-dehydratase [Pseudomonadota bacterium]
TKVMTASDGKIAVWGEGTEARDLLYIDDLVHCVEQSICRQSETFGLYNIGYGQAFAVKDVVERIIAASGRNIEITFDRAKPTIKTSLFLNCAHADAEINWRPQTDFQDGIRKTLDWYRRHFQT